MALVSIAALMESAKTGNYALGYFESWSLDSIQGVVDAAEEVRSPVIIGFNGEFLCEREGAKIEEIGQYGAMALAVAATTEVPIGLIFNECTKIEWTERAIRAGYNLVMPAPGTSAQEVARLAAVAHNHGIAIEAEPDTGELEDGTAYPKLAAKFAADTNIDLLAVEVGNEEIKLDGRTPLDLDLLAQVAELVSVPLVLHGGTGIEDVSLREAIKLGVRKVNYGTYIKQQYLSHFRAALNSPDPNPHALLGGGTGTDLLVVGRRVVRDAVLERIHLLGCCGQA
jgi:fructose/tagatose bisphosphate aldolase